VPERFTPMTGRGLFLGGALLLAVAVSYPAVQYWRADRWMNSSNFQDWEKAARLQPDNADYWDRLGRYRQLDFEHSDLAKAIEYYRLATQADPLQADYWLDLATTYENLGTAAEASAAFRKAKENYPLSSEVAWKYGNFLLRQGQMTQALAEIHRGVTGDPALVPLAASRAWHATGDMQRVLAEVLPATKEAYISALNVFVDEGATDPALAIWKRLVKLDQPFELRIANPLVDQLIAANRVAEAWAVWQEALVTSGTVPSGTQKIPLVTDGGFERSSTNGGLDWRTYPAAGVEYDFDSTVAHSGARSLRISFSGLSNISFSQVMQFVPVQPRTHYRLSAYIRTESLTTDSGIRIGVFHPGGAGTPDAFSDNPNRSQPWTLTEVEFTTGPETGVIEIHLLRFPSTRLENKIRGVAWVDDVTLVPAPPNSPGARP
jgi:tetratricopeptide (TPR) repeat protein